MINNVYFFFALLTALTCLAAAAAIFWKNRFQAVGPLLGGAMFLLAVWTLGFAHYFRRLDPPTALFWAKVTLTAAVAFLPPWFHGTCALVEHQRRCRWWILASYLWVLILLVALWRGNIITGLREARYMDHYVRYNPFWYVCFVGGVMVWQSLASGLLAYTAWRSVGYKRTNCAYILLVWFVAFLTINSILLPLEYNIDLPPIGLFALPWNFALVAYVMSRARLADFNVVLARVLAFAVALMVLVALCVVFIGGMTLLAPGFMTQEQLIFSAGMATVIGAAILVAIPRVLPRAERLLQERLLGSRAGYHDALTGLVRGFGPLTSIDELLGGVVATIHAQMQLNHAFILVLDPVSGRYRLRAQSGLDARHVADLPELQEDSAVVQRLVKTEDALVRDEL
ncbi:hypothetical protein HQ590_04365, partial [bacterium]|nr:hypothetical protein [bacterium]